MQNERLITADYYKAFKNPDEYSSGFLILMKEAL